MSITVTLKIATSLDARIALADGTSRWITNSDSRAYAHELRAKSDAILVGIGTALADDPLLTARTIPLPDRQPIRIIADSQCRLSPKGRLALSVGLGRVVVASATDIDNGLRDAGVDVWNCSDGRGKVSPKKFLTRAKSESISNLLIEGGGILAASFLGEQHVDIIQWFRAPIILGGDGLPAISALGLDTVGNASRWKLVDRRSFGDDSLETYHQS